MWGIIVGAIVGSILIIVAPIMAFISLNELIYVKDKMGKNIVERIDQYGNPEYKRVKSSKWKKVAASSVAMGIVASVIFPVFGGMHTNAQNVVTGYRSVGGDLTFTADAGFKVMNPLLKRIDEMSLTQQEEQFGDVDPTMGIEGYLPFNDSKNNEFNASANVKWSVRDRGHQATLDAIDLYKTIGTVNIHSDRIVSTIKQEAIQSMQNFVLHKGINGGAIETLQILSAKSAMAVQLKLDIQEALDAKYNIDGVGYIMIDAATIADIVAPDEIKAAISTAAAKSIESANAKTVAENQKIAAIAELEARKTQQQVKEQEALNDLLGNEMIVAALVSGGVDTSDVNSIAELAKALEGKTVNLDATMKISSYLAKWNGVLPTTILNDKTGMDILIGNN